MPVTRRNLVMVPAWQGQEPVAELARQAAAGERPRSDYVELAKALDADVLDMQYLRERASGWSRAVGRTAGVLPAQVVEALVRQRRYDHIVARADRLGLPLALLFKLLRGRRDTVLVSVWLSRPKKAVFLSRLGVHSHLGAIINYGSVQMEYARTRLGVPEGKLYHCPQPVDERFWRPTGQPAQDYILAVGAEARDYPTLARALEGIDIPTVVAVGSPVLRPSGDADALFGPLLDEAARAAGTGRMRLCQQVAPRELRQLYAGARLVVIPLRDVDFDAGVTAITEAMAMGRAVVATRSRGQVDIVRDNENGLYVPPGDVAALRTALRRLWNAPAEADRMGRAGRVLVESRHTLDRWVDDIVRITLGQSLASRQPVA